jgi:hypothetical protein
VLAQAKEEARRCGFETFILEDDDIIPPAKDVAGQVKFYTDERLHAGNEPAHCWFRVRDAKVPDTPNKFVSV